MMAVAIGLFAFVATPALADDTPTARDIQAAVDSYLASAQQDASLVGGPGSAGYDAGFWIRGGDFMLRINLTVQARYEYFKPDQAEQGLQVPGTNFITQDLSGFSVPRTTLKLSGTAPCSIRYYAEFEFGHFGRGDPLQLIEQPTAAGSTPLLVQNNNYDYGREAWIEWGCNDAFNFRMGLIKTPNTRQMMVPPELQQFIDISMASSITGWLMPGYTDRNRDHGVMLHGLFGCSNEFQYMFAVTNGDGGDSTRNVLDYTTSDNLAFSGRLNWTFLRGVGYTEGATRQSTCVWYGELGAWAYYYADRVDRPHTAIYDRMLVGGDLALGYGGFSFTGAFTYADMTGSATLVDENWVLWLVQLGYHFPGTAWEIAGRWSAYNRTIKAAGGDITPETNEFSGAINYYLNGHANKIQVDFTYLDPTANGGVGGGWFDAYAGMPLGYASNAASYLIRLQWQLAL